MSFRYFSREEFACQETGENEIKDEFIERLDALRDACGFPFVITSGYRSPRHSLEAKKSNGPGRHAAGDASDIAVVSGSHRFIIVDNAIKLGFNGIGVAKGFIHVDTRDTARVMWTY
jgi:uncharacterized protein YcbK (DUF882 family)